MEKTSSPPLLLHQVRLVDRLQPRRVHPKRHHRLEQLSVRLASAMAARSATRPSTSAGGDVGGGVGQPSATSAAETPPVLPPLSSTKTTRRPRRAGSRPIRRSIQTTRGCRDSAFSRATAATSVSNARRRGGDAAPREPSAAAFSRDPIHESAGDDARAVARLHEHGVAQLPRSAARGEVTRRSPRRSRPRAPERRARGGGVPASPGAKTPRAANIAWPRRTAPAQRRGAPCAARFRGGAGARRGASVASAKDL